MNIQTMQPETLDRIIKMLTNAASEDVTRPQLCHIQIKSRDKGADLFACDGHMLATCFVVDDALSKVKEAYKHREHLPYLKIVKKQNKHYLNAEIGEGKISLDGKLVTTPLNEIKYPDVKNYMTDYQEPVFQTSFNAKLLLDLATSLSDKKEPIVKLQFKRKDDHTLPIQVMVSGNKGVLMPCRQ